MAKTIGGMAQKYFANMSKQIRYGQMLGMNQTAFEVKKRLEKEIVKVFDNPTAQTKRSIYVVKAKKTDLKVTIKIKDQAAQGLTPADYLSPQIFGGTREKKRSEQLWGEYWVPGRKQRLNKYGNISGGQITKLLSITRSFEEVGFNANVTSTSKGAGTAKKIFRVWGKKHQRRKSNLLPGIYKRVRKRIQPLIIFIKQPKYKKRFNFEKVTTDNFFKLIDKNIDIGIEKAMKDAK